MPRQSRGRISESVIRVMVEFGEGKSRSNGTRARQTVDVVGGKESYIIVCFAIVLFLLEKIWSAWGKEGTGGAISQSTDTSVPLVCPPSL